LILGNFSLNFNYYSLRHRGPKEWWSKNATIEDWFDEMVGIANIIKKYAAVRIDDIKGRNIVSNSIVISRLN